MMNDTERVLEYVKKLDVGDLIHVKDMERGLQIPVKDICKVLVGRVASEGLVRWQYVVVKPIDSPYYGRIYNCLTETPSDVVFLSDVGVIFRRTENGEIEDEQRRKRKTEIQP